MGGATERNKNENTKREGKSSSTDVRTGLWLLTVWLSLLIRLRFQWPVINQHTVARYSRHLLPLKCAVGPTSHHAITTVLLSW
jgi:hypothetical protein